MADTPRPRPRVSALLRAGESIRERVRDTMSSRDARDVPRLQRFLPPTGNQSWQNDFRLYLEGYADEVATHSRETRKSRDYQRQQGIELEFKLPNSLQPLCDLIRHNVTTIHDAHIRNELQPNTEEYTLAEFIDKMRKEADDFKAFLVTLWLVKYALRGLTPSVYGLDISLSAPADTILGRKKYDLTCKKAILLTTRIQIVAINISASLISAQYATKFSSNDLLGLEPCVTRV